MIQTLEVTKNYNKSTFKFIFDINMSLKLKPDSDIIRPA